ncbi:MAG: YibE/F family protein [Clostridia bacterium]|nr:YibE/F family protein [Clostridia bacterium]
MFILPNITGWSMAEEQSYEEIPSEIVRGKILEIMDVPMDVEQYGSFVKDVQTVVVEITQGDFKGEVLTLDHVLSGNLAYDFYLDEGDLVLLWIETVDGDLVSAYVSEIVRDRYLSYLTIFFVLVLVIVGGMQGVKTVLTLAITGFFILKVLLPTILAGYNPIGITIIVASFIVTISLIITSGLNRKTAAAILGTIGGVVVAGIIALVMSSMTKLTGLSNDEAQMLMYIPQQIEFNFRGLLFAGMIIGAMGAVLDVGMSVASAMDEVRRANPDLSTRRLIHSGFNVGKDIMGTMSNTLILAYTGASMPLLLVFMAYDTPLVRIVNLDLIATEIVRALAGSIGLIFAIPITALAAGFLYRQQRNIRSGRGKRTGA